MGTIRYFAYGSNMLAQRLQKRCKSARAIGSAWVDGYTLAFTKVSEDGSGKATLVKSVHDAARVHGVLFELDARGKQALDRDEGPGYECIEGFEVTSGKDARSSSAITYIARANRVDSARTPYDWYLDLVIKGAEQHDLPEEYIQTLAAAQYLVDPDRVRPKRLKALDLLRKLERHGQPLKTRANLRIAGKRTIGEWGIVRARLIAKDQPRDWKAAYDRFFVERLRSRYFAPIRALRRPKRRKGEGFAIMAMQCSLIEFLGATYEGKTYRNMRNCNGDQNPNLRDFEYCDSKGMFVRFLTSRPPFSSTFLTEGLARSFYSDVRCGLLHEARTKGHWLIRADEDTGALIDTSNPKAKIVYRDNFQSAFDQFVEWYGKELQTNVELQQAFIRKFDSLCED